MTHASRSRRAGRWAFALVALPCAALGCSPPNMLGRPVVALEEHPYTFQGESLSYIEGTSVDDKAALPTKRPKEYSTRPVALFIEGDGSECQGYGEDLWKHFVQHFAGDFVLVRAKTYVNAACGTDRFVKFDFLSRLDELDQIISDLKKNHAGQPLVLIGDSAGATLAALYADKHAGSIAAIVNLGGSLDSLDAVIKQAEREKGLGSGMLRESEDTLDAAIAESSGGSSPDKPMWGRTQKFWGQMFTTNVKAVWLKLTMPVLVVHGDGDKNVPYALMPKTRREFKRANKTNYTFLFEEGMGHDLLSTDVFLSVDAWLKKKLAGGATTDSDSKGTEAKE